MRETFKTRLPTFCKACSRPSELGSLATSRGAGRLENGRHQRSSFVNCEGRSGGALDLHYLQPSRIRAVGPGDHLRSMTESTVLFGRQARASLENLLILISRAMRRLPGRCGDHPGSGSAESARGCNWGLPRQKAAGSGRGCNETFRCNPLLPTRPV